MTMKLKALLAGALAATTVCLLVALCGCSERDPIGPALLDAHHDSGDGDVG